MSAVRLYLRMSKLATSPAPSLNPPPSTITNSLKVSILVLWRVKRHQCLEYPLGRTLSCWYEEETFTAKGASAGTISVIGSRPRK